MILRSLQIRPNYPNIVYMGASYFVAYFLIINIFWKELLKDVTSCTYQVVLNVKIHYACKVYLLIKLN